MRAIRNNNMLLLAVPLTLAMFVAPPLQARQKSDNSDEVERIHASIQVLQELTATPDQSIPRYLLDRSEAIVVIPTLVKGGFIIGAKHGLGVMSLRSSETRDWSMPAFVTMTGGSIGWQIGVESVDLVLLVMNQHGVSDLLSDKFTLGGTASVAAGPLGRSADAATDAKLTSEILAYSRTKGLFAGAALEGASLHGDKDSNLAFYGQPLAVRAIVEAPSLNARAPDSVQEWRQELRRITSQTK